MCLRIFVIVLSNILEHTNENNLLKLNKRRNWCKKTQKEHIILRTLLETFQETHGHSLDRSERFLIFERVHLSLRVCVVLNECPSSQTLHNTATCRPYTRGFLNLLVLDRFDPSDWVFICAHWRKRKVRLFSRSVFSTELGSFIVTYYCCAMHLCLVNFRFYILWN